MSKLPRLSGRDCVKALNKVNFREKRQHGSHIILRRDEPFAELRRLEIVGKPKPRYT